MSTALTIYERITDPLAVVNSFGNDIAKSGMFGCQNVEQGRVFAWECLVRGTPALSLAEDYHVIDNKLSMKADAMLARFSERGGKHRLQARTGDQASIELTTKDGDKQVFSLSWEEAQCEPFVYVGSEKENAILLAKGDKPAKIKTKYLTPRSRSQMLWARIVSDGVRALDPGAVRGKYTPEEISDWSDEDRAAKGDGRANENGNGKSATVVEPAAASTATTATSSPKDDAVDVPFEVNKPAAVEPPYTRGYKARMAGKGRKDDDCQDNNDAALWVQGWDAADVFEKSKSTATVDPAAKVTPEVAKRIKELTASLGCGEKLNEALAKRKVGAVRELLASDAAAILDRLEINFAKTQLEASKNADALAGQSSVAETTSPVSCGPATPEQIDRLKAKLKEYSQIDPQIVAKVGAKLKESGRQKLSDLSANDAARLYDDLSVKNIDAFFKRSLETWEPLNTATTDKPQPATQAAAATATQAAA